MITGKTKSGFSYEISEARLKNYELVELLADVDTNPFLLPKLVKVMLGEELANKLKDHVRDEEGLVDLEKINQGYLDYIKTQTDLNVLIIDVSDLDFVKKQEDYVFLLNEINTKISKY